MAAAQGGYLERPKPSGLADVVEVILDKGLVVDAYVRISLIGIELVTIDARIVIASVDTYLRFAEAVNRLDLTETEVSGLPELQEIAAKEVTKHKLEGAAESVAETATGGGTGRRAAKVAAAALGAATAAYLARDKGDDDSGDSDGG